MESRSISPLPNARSEKELFEDQTDTLSSLNYHNKTLRTSDLSTNYEKQFFQTKKSFDINFEDTTNEVNRLMKILGNQMEKLNNDQNNLYIQEDWSHFDDLENQLVNLERLLEKLDSGLYFIILKYMNKFEY